MPTGDKPNSPRPPAGRDTQKPVAPGDQQTPPSTGESPRDVDFGSYVSSTVRSSAELFGTPARKAPSRRQRTDAPEPTAVQPEAKVSSTSTPAPRPRPPVDEPLPSADRPQRRWRDLAASEQYPEDDPGTPVSGASGGGNGGTDWRDRFPWAFDEDGNPNWMILGGILLALVAAILLVWFLFGRDGGGEDNPTPTPTEESVIDAPVTNNGDSATPPSFVPPDDGDTEPTPTTEPRRGGDNTRNQDDGTPEASNGDPLAGIELGPVAQQCSDRCMVRIADNGSAESLMLDANTRPSFAADGWVWTITSPEGIAWFEENTETTLVTPSADTLSLYMAWVPGEESSSDRVKSLGTVLDSAGSWRLVSANSVPANVRPLTDWGYLVEKVVPAPPVETSRTEEPTAIQTVEIGSLIDDVSVGNIESSITDVVGMGSADGSGVGTRYYTSAANSAAAEYLFSRLESYGLTVWYEDFLTWEGYLVVNVIGEVPGNDESAIYGVMAHFDTISTDLDVSPGADDNATGVAASLEIARVLSGYELQHPVRIIFVNVEEVGIIGSQEFARNAKEQGIPYEGVFNLDSIGAQRQYSYVVLNGDSSTAWMSDLFIRFNDAYGLNQTINSMANDQIVADDNRLRENGIDSIMIGRELYGQSPYHHTPGDMIDTLSLPGVERLTQLTLISLAYLAQG